MINKLMKTSTTSGRNRIFLLLFVVLNLMMGCGDRENSASRGSQFPSRVEVMETAPDFMLNDLAGNQRSSQDYKGKITVLNFWATWCGYCVKEIPEFNHLNRKYGAQGVQIVGVSLDASARVVRRFIEDRPISYDVLMGNREISFDFGGIAGLPTTFIIDQQWRIRQVFPGYVGQYVIEKEIKALLSTKG
jgi:peroxiredoxin